MSAETPRFDRSYSPPVSTEPIDIDLDIDDFGDSDGSISDIVPKGGEDIELVESSATGSATGSGFGPSMSSASELGNQALISESGIDNSATCASILWNRPTVNPFEAPNCHSRPATPIKYASHLPYHAEAAATLRAPTTGHHRRLSLSQQSKLINFLDESLLKIARKYIQRLTRHDESDVPLGYTALSPLLADAERVVDILWYSIVASASGRGMENSENFGVKNSGEDVGGSGDNNSGKAETGQSALHLFGQTQYLIKIADDSIEWIGNLPLDDPVNCFRYLSKLDQILCCLLDGKVPGNDGEVAVDRMNGTERVRLESIAERTRVVVTNKMETVGGFHDEVADVYKGVLERVG